MPAAELECLFIGDKFERCVRQCIVFPADGAATRIAHMIVETVTTTQEITALRSAQSMCGPDKHLWGRAPRFEDARYGSQRTARG